MTATMTQAEQHAASTARWNEQNRIMREGREWREKMEAIRATRAPTAEETAAFLKAIRAASEV